MEIHESRVSQLKSQGVLRLRAYLRSLLARSRSGAGNAAGKVKGKA